MQLLQAFDIFPKEAQLIARLLAGYADLEVDLMNCVQVVRGNDLNTVFKAMFGQRGEKRRIDIAEQLARDGCIKLQLSAELNGVIDSIHHCRQIRNNYAHGYWHNDNSGKIAYVPFEELALTAAPVHDLSGLDFKYLDSNLLDAQFSYYANTMSHLNWLNCESRFRAGNMHTNPFQKPNQIAKPAFHL